MIVRQLAFVLILAGQIPLAAQPVQPDAITIEHGLSQGMVFDLCQTRDGFLWVATKDGLNRYDGYNFKVFANDPFDPYSLAENTVTALFEDSRGWLWVGLDSKGLSLYDRKSERFHHILFSFNRKNNAPSFEVSNICEAPDGSILLLQRSNELVHVQIPSGWEKQLPAEADLTRSIQVALFSNEQFKTAGKFAETYLETFDVLDANTVIVYSNNGLYRVELSGRRVYPVDAASSGMQYRNRNVWGTASHDLYCFQNGVRRTLHFPPGLKIKTSMVREIPGGRTFVAINGMLWQVPKGGIPDFFNPDFRVDADISAVTTDRNGNVWIGTQGYGLRKFNPKKQLFRKAAAGTSIWGLWRDARGRYYVKVVNQIFPFDPFTGRVGDRQAFPSGPARILDMVPEPDGSCWVVGRGEAEYGSAELRWYDADLRTFKSYPFPPDTSRPVTGRRGPAEQWIKHYIYSRLLKTRDGHLLATGLNCHLARFFPQTGRFDLLDYSSLFAERAATVRAFALAEDGNGTIWIGTQQGLVRGSTVAGGPFVFDLFATDPSNPQSISNNSITCLLPDLANPKGVLWIGTRGGGINRMDLRSGHVQHITTRDGLPDNVVYGILPGDAGELWCSTNRGLAKIHPSYGDRPPRITSFTAAQGLQDNEFNTQAFFKADNGELLFGGVNGLNRFFPREVLPDTLPPPVFVVGLRINHEAADFRKPDSPLDRPLGFLRTLELEHDQNNLTFEFAVLDFTDPSKNQYRYRLVGVDPGWVETGTNRFAYFTHLAPGRYTLLVQGNNGEGAWRDAAHPIAITILPPWWRSDPACALYGILVLLAGWQAYRFQMRRVKLREQLAFELRETARVKALEQMKTDFFSNVTHEFRTPLTLIIEPLHQVLKNPDDPLLTEKLRLAENNSRKLLALVNQLLDLAKLESGQMTFDARMGNFGQILREVFETFLPLAEKRGIKLTLRVSASLPNFVFDAGKVELVFNNLLSNALKFTPEGGQVDLDCQFPFKTAGGSEGVQVIVRDTGIGIPAEALDKIFDRFYQADSSLTRSGEGTGIGLALSKELAVYMGGGITVDSVQGEGSVFAFWLPLSAETNMKETPPAPYTDAMPGATKPNEHLSASAQPSTRPPHAETPLVLIIEDNAEMREFIRHSVGPAWQTAEASDGEEGLKKAADLLPDLIVSDLTMPRKDGFAVCEELKNDTLTAHIPIILLTAKSAMDSKVGGLRRGADDYLTKPFNTEELLARMENLVEQRRRLRQLFAQTAPVPASGPNAPLPDFLSEPDREFLHKINRLLEQHLQNENFGVDDLAHSMHISRSQLHRKLKALTDRAATDLIRDYRLDRAYAMLKNREGRVGEIALRTGFVNEKHFATVFRERFGMPPSQVSGQRN